MAQLPTVTDVARLAGVSGQTVSNVLNRPTVVRPETRVRVELAIAQLGYRTHASARRLRTRKSSTIGVRLDPVTQGISGSFLDRYLHAFTELATERGMRVLLYTAEEAEDEIDTFQQLLEAADVDAFMLSSTIPHDPRTAWLIRNGAKFVTFGRPWEQAALADPRHLWVDVDGRTGVAESTRLLAGRGCSNIGFLGWPGPDGPGDDRRDGWELVSKELFGYDDEQLRSRVATSRDLAQDARREMSSLLQRHPDLDGVVCASDTLCLGAWMAATDADRNDLLLTGFDNSAVSEAVGFSSVDQRLEDVAHQALDLLMGETGRAVLNREMTAEEAHRLITPFVVDRTDRRSS